jgi:hypothetical protein
MAGFENNGADMFSKEDRVLGAPEVAKGSVPIIGIASSITAGIARTTPIPTLPGQGVGKG